MSSLFTVAEIELARIGLAQLSGSDLDVVVGGLGLGYTALAALEESRVRSMHVVEGLEQVVEWHRRKLLPLGEELTADPRNHFVTGDFFSMALGEQGFDPDEPGRRFDAVLVDIDHSPRHTLDSGHGGFYAPDGLRRLAAHLQPGGVFALWSDDPPDEDFQAALAEVFADVQDHSVFFDNPYGGPRKANTIYTARRPA
jgi:spermidine synthase